MRNVTKKTQYVWVIKSDEAEDSYQSLWDDKTDTLLQAPTRKEAMKLKAAAILAAGTKENIYLIKEITSVICCIPQNIIYEKE